MLLDLDFTEEDLQKLTKAYPHQTTDEAAHSALFHGSDRRKKQGSQKVSLVSIFRRKTDTRV